MNSEVICLRQEHAVGKAARDRLMSMTGDKGGDVGKLGSQRHHGIRKIIATGARLQAHMTRQHHSICAFSLGLRNRAAHGVNGVLKANAAGEFRRKPKRHPRRGDPDDRKLDPRDVLQNERLNFREWMFRVGKFPRELSFQDRVRSQHGHC